MASLKIPVLKSPEAFVTKYVSNKIGFNIRASKAIYDDKTDTYTINLKAIIPSMVKLGDKSSKTFVYTFENIGKAVVKYEDYDFDFVSKPIAPELDFSLLRNFDKLTAEIQKIILDYGKYSWGKLTNVKYWMGPIRSIIVRCLKEEEFYADQNVSPRYIRYFAFLDSAGWIKYQRGSHPFISKTNKLTMLYETLSTDHGNADVGQVADSVIGNLCSEHYYEIRDELRLFGLDIYVTTTRAYYADAVREGKPIPMSQHRLWLKYRSYNYKPRPSVHKEYTFSNAVTELVSNNFLKRTKDEKFITANNELLELLLPYHDELARNVIEI
ncbi:MAG: hypothetical protein WEB28_02920 [Nitrosopumilaceae archaeon]